MREGTTSTSFARRNRRVPRVALTIASRSLFI